MTVSEIDTLVAVLGRFWEDPAITGVRRLGSRASTRAYPDADSARAAGDSPWERSLDGRWRFSIVPSPLAAPRGWTTDDVRDDSRWRTVDVPGCWTMQDVGDAPRYTNIVMPFTSEPPLVPEQNPTGLYRCSFRRPRAWRGRRTILHLGAAESLAAVWCNGSFVGIGTDSRLPSEFDISDHLVAGDNIVAVMVVRWSAATWVEDQDHWIHAGLHRSVSLRSRADVSLDDVQVRSVLGADLSTGTLSIDATVTGDAVGWCVDIELETLRGRTVLRETLHGVVRSLDRSSHLVEMADAYAFLGSRITERATVPSVHPWSHEDPHRYRVLVRLVDPDGVQTEVVSVLCGFTRVEIGGRELRLNGVALPIAGVNRHDHDPDTGKVQTAAQLRDDIVAIKRAGMNALRTAHYPPDPALLDACDEIGLWVICEANLESHARWRSLVDDVRFEPLFVERVQRMVAVHGNHPSVMAWSLGNESGHGAAHDAAAAWARAHDPSRFVHYEGAIMGVWRTDPDAADASVATDVISPMYPQVADLVTWATTSHGEKPLIMCEYTHAMGNSNGGLDAYWAAIDAHHGLQGGFIWDWRDQGLSAVDAHGRHYWAYGGHPPGDHPTDYDFCCNGIVGPDGRAHPALEEHRWLTRPIRVEWADGRRRRIKVTNRRGYISLDDLTMTVEVAVDGVVIDRTTVAAPDLAPGSSTTLPLPVSTPTVREGQCAHAIVRWRQRRATPWCPAGHEIAHDQIELPARVRGTIESRPTLAVTVGDESVSVGPMTVELDRAGGGGIGSIRLGRRELLAEPTRLSLWRAPTDNDGPKVGPGTSSTQVRPRWAALGIDRLRFVESDASLRRVRDGAVLRTAHRWWSEQVSVEHIERTRVRPDGVLVFDEEVRLPADVDDWPRVGVRLALPGSLDRLTWFGPGPEETYSDRWRGAVVGRWTSPVADQYVPYVLPQHHGSHAQTRWFSLTDRRGAGLLFVLDGLSFDASSISVERLTAATTTAEVETDDLVHVHIDGAIRGVGTGACGPDVTPDHRVRGGRHRFRWMLAPLTAGDEPGRVAVGVRQGERH